jgi:hypothetical protein
VCERSPSVAKLNRLVIPEYIIKTYKFARLINAKEEMNDATLST